MPPTPPTAATGALDLAGALLVRIAATDRSWAAALPPVPGSTTLTVTVGHPSLTPVPVDDLVGGGYRLAGVAPVSASMGMSVDVLVPAAVRETWPEWWDTLVHRADRVFDLRHGPVLMVLADEIALHHRAGSNH